MMTPPKLDRNYAYMLRVLDNTYDIRNLVSIEPLDSDNYWDANELELTFKDGSSVQVYYDDIENAAILDDWVETV